MKKILNSLSEDEHVLILDTKKDRMIELGEDGLIALHTRVRQARTKYPKNYRRAGSVRVGAKKGRGSGKSANNRNAGKPKYSKTPSAESVAASQQYPSRAPAISRTNERLRRARKGRTIASRYRCKQRKGRLVREGPRRRHPRVLGEEEVRSLRHRPGPGGRRRRMIAER